MRPIRVPFALAIVATLAVIGAAPPAQAAEPGPWQRLSYNELPRFVPAWAYDPVGHRVIYYGTDYRMTGGNFGDIYTTLALTLGTNPTWAPLDPAGGPPDNSHHATMIHDPVGQRMILFGLTGLWELSLGPSPAWAPLSAGGTPPQNRHEHCAIYDPIGHRMIVHGGQGYSREVFALNLGASPAWTEITPAGPSIGHHGALAVYDPIGHRMIVDGGELEVESSGYQWSSETWALTLDATPTWSSLTPAEGLPAPRNRHGGFYDPVRHSLVTFGGWVDGGGPTHASNEVWELTLGPAPQWTLRAPSGTPPAPRRAPLVLHDPVADRMLLFGGWSDGNPPPYYDDTWELALGASPEWTQLAPDGGPPNLAPGSTTVIDPVDGSLLVYGGVPQEDKPETALRAFPLSGPRVWRALHPSGTAPPNRANHSSIVDAAGPRMIVFGGTRNGDGVTTNEVWALELGADPAWTQLSPAGTPPAPRHSHVAIYDPIRQRMVVHGGEVPGTGKSAEVWVLSLDATPTWSLLALSALPPNPGARAGHSAVLDAPRDRMVLFGGETSSGVLTSGTHALSLGTSPAWAVLGSGSVPPARRDHAAIYDEVGQRMVVFGGDDDGYKLQDTWILPLWKTPSWSLPVLDAPLPVERYAHGAVYDAAGGRMVIHGGALWFGHTPDAVNDTWALPLASCPPPIITAQPEALSIPYGGTAVFNVTATGATSYRWRKNGTPMNDGGRVSGAMTASLTITGFQSSDVATYTVRVAGSCPPDEVISDPATLAQAAGCNTAQASPPAGMAAWWAMDPGPGNTIPDVLNTTGNKNHASRTGNAMLVPGRVGLAVRCEEAGDGLHVPATLSPRLAAQSSGLSIDAWVRPRSGHPTGGLRMILQKGLMTRGSVQSGGNTALAPGYAFWLREDGRMAFQMPDLNYQPVTFEPTMPAVTSDTWQHVAVTIEPGPDGGRFFLNGVVVATFTPPSGILGNLADLYIGRFAPQTGPSGADLGFHGDIDEVEIFTTAVDSAEIRKIWAAGCAGKRRVQVATNSLAEIRGATGEASVCSAIRNLSLVQRTYQWSIATTGPTANCPSSVPVTFTPSSGTVPVGAGGRVNLTSAASVDGGSLSAPFLRCFRLTVTDQTDGAVMIADGTLSFTGAKLTGRVACTPPEVGVTWGGALARAGDRGPTLGFEGDAAFTVTNDSTDAVTLDYVIETRDPDTGGPSGLLRLGGQGHGVPLAGSILVPALGAAPIEVSIGLDEYEPFVRDELILTADRDGDSAREPLAAQRVVSLPDTSLAFVGVGPGEVVAPGGAGRGGVILALRALPNPSTGMTSIAFTLARASRVEASVYDIAGQRVRQLASDRAMHSGGEHRLLWDGRSHSGDRVMAGLYLVRVRAAGDEKGERITRVIVVR